MNPDCDFWSPIAYAAVALVVYLIRRASRRKQERRVTASQRVIVRGWPPQGKGY